MKLLFIGILLIINTQTFAQSLENYKINTMPSKETEAKLLAATVVYMMYCDFLEDIPQGSLDPDALQSFIDHKFTKGAMIQDKVRDQIIEKTPQKYFDNLQAKYIGANAKFDKSSKIISPKDVKPIPYTDKDGNLLIVIEVTQTFNNSKNGVKKEQVIENRKVKIIFTPVGKYREPQIKYISLEN